MFFLKKNKNIPCGGKTYKITQKLSGQSREQFVFMCCFLYVSSGRNLLPKFMPISLFRRVSRLYGVSGHLVLQEGKSWGILECYPVLSLNGLKLCKFVSRSDLVLDADHALDFLSYLVLQACILFCSVSDRSGTLLCCLVQQQVTLKPVIRIFLVFRVRIFCGFAPWSLPGPLFL